jgi:hypothetical protein
MEAKMWTLFGFQFRSGGGRKEACGVALVSASLSFRFGFRLFRFGI